MSVPAARLEHLLGVYKGLVEVSALINGIIDSEELLPAILDVSRRVLEVEAASLFLLTRSGDLALKIARGDGLVEKTVQTAITVPRGRDIAGWVLENRKPLLIPDAYADPRFYRDVDRQTGFRTRSILCVPLMHNKTEIGVLQVLNPIGREAFDEADLEAFMAYGNLAATAIEKVRTIERQRSQDRIAQEFAFARDIQTSFLPQTLPQLDTLKFGALYRPAENVGGDFYDVLVLGPDEIYFVIGDVAGKGMPAALLMAQALSILRLIVKSGISPVAVLARWNAMLSGHTIRGMFITALVGRIICSSRDVELCSAGHCPPLRVKRDGLTEDVNMAGSPPLGVVPQLSGNSHHLVLEPGEWLVSFTDGLIDSFNSARDPLGRTGITRLLANAPPTAESVVEKLSHGEMEHRGAAAPHDDLTLLVFGFK